MAAWLQDVTHRIGFPGKLGHFAASHRLAPCQGAGRLFGRSAVQKAPVVVVYRLPRGFSHLCLRAQATCGDCGRGFEGCSACGCRGSTVFLWICWCEKPWLSPAFPKMPSLKAPPWALLGRRLPSSPRPVSLRPLVFGRLSRGCCEAEDSIAQRATCPMDLPGFGRDVWAGRIHPELSPILCSPVLTWTNVHQGTGEMSLSSGFCCTAHSYWCFSIHGSEVKVPVASPHQHEVHEDEFFVFGYL